MHEVREVAEEEWQGEAHRNAQGLERDEERAKGIPKVEARERPSQGEGPTQEGEQDTEAGEAPSGTGCQAKIRKLVDFECSKATSNAALAAHVSPRGARALAAPRGRRQRT